MTAFILTLLLSGIGAPASLGSASDAKASARPTVVRVEDRSGFDWADAGVGAAGGFALSVVALGLVLLVSARSRPST